MQNVSPLPPQAIADECSRLFREAGSILEEQRMALASVTEATERYGRRARLVEFARGFCTAMVVTFLSLSVYSFVQANYSFALGFLGPAVASLFGVWGFRMSRFMAS